MDDRINLDFDEVIIFRSERIRYGGAMSGYINDLVLTNKNLVLVKKGILGSVKDTIRFPLMDIKVYNGEPQVRVGKANNGSPSLDVYFITGQESFVFEWKKDAVKWAEQITGVMTGRKPTGNSSVRISIPGSELIARTLKGTIDTYKETLGFIKKEEHITRECSGCGAVVEGIRGNTTKCPYCGTFITL